MTNKQKIKLAVSIAAIVGVGLLAGLFFANTDIAVLDPKGMIADEERDLFVFTVALSLVVVIPVFIMLGVFAWKYRENNPKKTEYAPDWDSNRLYEGIWWAIPCVIILILSVITWQTSHQLDPFKKLDSDVKPLRVQVIALQWKWLFIYPEQRVASINLLELPEKTPINFEITSDAPMNSFWIPSLGSQIYAMSGMSTKLHLIANEPGDYKGSSANISGTGFADMAFTARVVPVQEFDAWVQNAATGQNLNKTSYNKLAKPGRHTYPTNYWLEDPGLYASVVLKYMMPESKPAGSYEMEGM